MATDLFIYIVLGIVQIVTAVYGGIVSMRTTQADSNGKRHIVYFAVLGGIGVLFVAISGIRAYDAQKESEKVQHVLRQDLSNANEKMNQSLLAQEYMKGQLATIGTTMRNIGERKDDPVLGQMANTINKLASSSSSTIKSEYSGQRTTSGLIYTGSGFLRNITAQPDGKKECTIQVYDGTDATGKPIGFTSSDAGERATHGWSGRNIPLTKGLYIKSTNCVFYDAEYTKGN